MRELPWAQVAGGSGSPHHYPGRLRRAKGQSEAALMDPADWKWAGALVLCHDGTRTVLEYQRLMYIGNSLLNAGHQRHQ